MTTVETIDNKVKQVISNIRNLPTPPIVFQQIQKVINDPNCSATKVASVLSEDPAMSVKVLKLTNSAFYGLSREVDSVKHAVVIVGMEAVKNLVLSASVLGMFKGTDVDREFEEKFWRHSLATGACCRILARKTKAAGIVDPDAAFSAGLLHDIGKIVVLSFLKEEAALLKEARLKDNTTPDYQLEDKIVGYNHAQIGGFLAVQWKLPKNLAKAISLHHRVNELENLLEDPLVSIVHLADYMAKRTFDDTTFVDPEVELHRKVMEYLQLSEDNMDEIEEELREDFLKAETFMQMAGL